MQPTYDFLNSIWEYDNVHVLRELAGESETIADGDPYTYFTSLGCAIRSQFYGEDADDDDTAPEIDWDTVARLTDEWLAGEEYARMRQPPTV